MTTIGEMHFFGAFPYGTHLFICYEGMIITFCGHSTFFKSVELEQQLLSILQSQVGDNDVAFYLGGYGSFDSFARECCRKFQTEHPQARLVYVTPYLEIDKLTLKLYDESVYPPIEERPLKFAISYRNKWMVESADLVIAYVNHSSGGAWQTYQHAKRKKKNIINLGKLDK